MSRWILSLFRERTERAPLLLDTRWREFPPGSVGAHLRAIEARVRVMQTMGNTLAHCCLGAGFTRNPSSKM